MAKKKTNEELNLTPFIDLFSTLVAFLLLTAVWNQISTLSTNIDNSTSSDNPIPQEKQVSLAITIFPDKIQMLEDEKLTDIAHLPDNSIDVNRLIIELRNWKERFPDREDVTLNTINNTEYGKMIVVFDTLVGERFPEVGVNTQ